MSLAQLKQQVMRLSPAEQGELIAFLASIQDDELRVELTCKLDDANPANWVSLDDLERRWADSSMRS